MANAAEQTPEEPERTTRQWKSLQLIQHYNISANRKSTTQWEASCSKTSMHIGIITLNGCTSVDATWQKALLLKPSFTFDVRSFETTAAPKPSVKTHQILIVFSLKLLEIGASHCLKQYLTSFQPGSPGVTLPFCGSCGYNPLDATAFNVVAVESRSTKQACLWFVKVINIILGKRVGAHFCSGCSC